MKSNKNEEEENSMLYISFNQDNSFFSIGTEKGFLYIEPSHSPKSLMFEI